MGMTAQAALWFLPAVIPLAIYISWNDMATMKITNRSVYVVVAAYAVLGPLAFGLEMYLWQWLHLPVLLAICILLWMARVMGAGDAKLIAAMGPYFVLADEATGNLDSKTTEEVLDLFESLNQGGKTIVMITHEDEVAERAKRVIRLRDGMIESDKSRPQRIAVGR